MKKTKISLPLLVILLLAACKEEQQTSPYVASEYWKKQALTDILPYWTIHARDTAPGSFYCNLDKNWQPVGEPIKFPSMLSRHLFSYSSAYLMSGDESYLKLAREIKDYLIKNAWDYKYGGWFDALASDHKPLQKGKSTFVQVYVLTGLALYYMVTHDREVLDYINRSNDLLEEKAWDHTSGGYADALEQDWTIHSPIKSLSAQLAPVSGYLLYLYLATRDQKYLDQSERICDIISGHMVDATSGWVLEAFDTNWNYIPGRQNEAEINIGHNIEISWSMLRLHTLTGRKDYLQSGKTLADRVHKYGFQSIQGFWYATIGNKDPDQHSDYTYWWIQAYGNMFDLYLNKLYPKQHYLDHFSQGAAFWDTYFLDKENGDTHLSVLENGTIREGQKANQYKASYHSMEHCLLNYLYLACWVHRKPVTLYFKITAGKSGDTLYPVPIEMIDAQIADIRINNEKYTLPSPNQSFINLPPNDSISIAVTFQPASK